MLSSVCHSSLPMRVLHSEITMWDLTVQDSTTAVCCILGPPFLAQSLHLLSATL